MNRIAVTFLLALLLSACCEPYQLDYCMRARVAARADAIAATLTCDEPYAVDEAWQDRDPLRPGTWDECYDEVYMIIYNYRYAAYCLDDTGTADTGT